MNPTTFVEGTYGFIRNELTGGNENGVLVNDSSNRLNGLADFPMIYPNAGQVNRATTPTKCSTTSTPPFWDGQNDEPAAELRVGRPHRRRAAEPALSRLAEHQPHPGRRRQHDQGRRPPHDQGRVLQQPQLQGAERRRRGGLASRATSTSATTRTTPLDTGFGYANAALGVFTRYQQASKFVEGSMIYNNTEFYLQDNWKVTNRLTLDYGMRFTHQQPQYDQFQQMSNFFPDQWNSAQAPTFYVAGCSNGAAVCSGNTRNAMDPAHRPDPDRAGPPTAQAAIGTPIPNSGNLLNGIRQAGDGIAKTGYTWPALVARPALRHGLRHERQPDDRSSAPAAGRIYDRPDGNTVFSIPGNPPIATSQDLRYGQLQTLGPGPQHRRCPRA